MVEDTQKDERFASNPLVTGSSQIRFYAGAPLITSDGHALGMLCVKDRVPRELSKVQMDALRALSRQVVAQMELKHSLKARSRSEDQLRATADALRASELMYRRLFEAAQDGILILDIDTGRITEVNLFLVKLLGFSSPEMVGKTVGELSPFKDIESNQAMLQRLQKQGYARYENLPLETRDGRKIAVEFVSNVYQVGNKKVIQCNVRDITERKKAEEERQRSNVQVRLLLESAVEGICGVDTEWRCTFINRAGMEMLGYKSEEVLGRNLHDLIHHHHKDGSLYPIEDCPMVLAFQKREGCSVDDDCFLRADGTAFPALYTSRPLFEGPVVTGVVITFSDITERKRAEEILRSASLNEKGRQNRKIFKDLTVIAVLSIFVFAMGNRFDLFGAAFRNIIRLDNAQSDMYLDEIVGTLVFICLALLVFSYRRWKESRAETVTQTQVSRALGHLHADMETRVQQRTAELVKANEELQTEAVERKRALEQIAEQAALLDKARDAILVRDLKGKILFWNKGAERMYGWTGEEVLGRNIGELLYTDPKKFETVNGLSISQGEWQGELQHLTKDRSEITIEARWTLIRDNEGNPKSIFAINTDITERKKIEAQFMRAQRMESIGTLAGGIAHDLNNILAPIMMSIDILKLSATDPQAKIILNTIEISAKRGSDIVRQVLTFARGLEGERIEVQPKHLLKDLESIIKDTFPNNIQLNFSIPNDTWTILGDPTQVHQILLNLCINARDAMPNGGHLTICVENCVQDEHYAAMNLQAKPGRYVIINVTDSGMGMVPAIVDKIFDPFFTTKGLTQGTGLGLSTVMAIVKSHEGTINVYSEPDKGTTFKVSLPAMEMLVEAQKTPTQSISLPRGNGETVLVVDDEASILIITNQTLEAFGYRVLTATDGAEAVAVYAQHKNEIDVVLTDMMMPIMDGAAVIRALRKINPSLKMIAASGFNANGGAAKVAESGVKHFLTKPYTAGTLLKTMRTILDEV